MADKMVINGINVEVAHRAPDGSLVPGLPPADVLRRNVRAMIRTLVETKYPGFTVRFKGEEREGGVTGERNG